MVIRKRHPDKDIEQAIIFAEQYGWRYQRTGRSAHAWVRLLCPEATRGGCILSIWSTPRDGVNHAKQILRQVQACQHITRH